MRSTLVTFGALVIWLAFLPDAAHAAVAPCAAPIFHAQQRENARTQAKRPLTTYELAIKGRSLAPVVGDQQVFWAADLTNYDGTVESIVYYQLTATLHSITSNTYFYIENGVPYDGPTITRFENSFSLLTYPQVRRVFGEEWSPGIDNDPRVTILLTSIRSPDDGELGTIVGGYFNDIDEYSSDVEPFSNEREMLYINVDLLDPNIGAEQVTREVAAHEFQHLCQWNQDPNEELWLNEGLSMVAPVVAGVAMGTDSLLANAVISYGWSYDNQLTVWGDQGEFGTQADYGSSGLFCYYIFEKYGEDALGRIARHAANGAPSVEAALQDAGCLETFDNVFTRWTITNFIDDPSVGDFPFYFGYNTTAFSEVRNYIRILNELFPELIPLLFDPTPAPGGYPTSGGGVLGHHSVEYIEFTGAVGGLDIIISSPSGGRLGAFVSGERGDGTHVLLPVSFNGAGVGSLRVTGIGTTITGPIILAITGLQDVSTDFAYEASSAPDGPLPPDVLPPCSAALLEGSPAALSALGPYAGEVLLHLLAADFGSGVAWLRHRVNGGSWQNTDPQVTVGFSAPGEYVVEFYASDNAGNAEAPHTLEFTIQAPPARLKAPGKLRFGRVAVGESLVKKFWIKNTGGYTLTGKVRRARGPYKVIQGQGDFSLEPGESKKIRVRFTPTATGRVVKKLKITSNDPNRPTKRVKLIGKGT